MAKFEKMEYQKEIVRVAMVRAEIYSNYPRLYDAFDHIDMIMTTNVPTMGVAPTYYDNKELTGDYEFYWNPEFVQKLSDKQLKGVILHEVLHILLKHTTCRRPDLKTSIFSGHETITDEIEKLKAITWNEATDVAINQLIREFLQDSKSDFKGGLFPESFNPPLISHQNAEYYYKELYKKNKEQFDKDKKFMEQLKEFIKQNGLDSHDGWVEVDKDGKIVKVGGKTVGKGTGKEKGEGSGGDEKSDLEEVAVDLGLDGFQPEAKAGVGTNASTKVKLDVGRQKKTPGWMKQTKHASVHGYDIVPLSTRKVPNRRFGLNFPGKRRQQIGNKVLVAIDVSGSINRPLYKEFQAHLNNMQRFADFDIVFFNSWLIDSHGKGIFDNSNWDFTITKEQARAVKLEKYKMNMDCHIGGGTNFEPVIVLYNYLRHKYDALFVFTDGEGGYSTKPLRKKEVNWIVYNSYPEGVKKNMPEGNIHFMQLSGGEEL
jgi:predicted metal-dependent peptidase